MCLKRSSLRTFRPTCPPSTISPEKSCTFSLQVRTATLDSSSIMLTYMWHTEAPSPNATAVEDPLGQVPSSYAYSFSQVKPTPLAGGAVKIADSTVFPIATGIAVAELTVEPGSMR